MMHRSLRELTTDRPDITESPFTVDPGHLQVETAFSGYRRSFSLDDVREEAWEFATSNLRIGVTRSLEVAVGFQPYGIVQAGRQRFAGVGGIELRAKLNLAGNRGEKIAVGLLPFVTVPTDPGNRISPDFPEVGLLVPVAFNLTHRLGVAVNFGISGRREGRDEPFRPRIPLTASLGYAWGERFATFHEVAVEVTPGADTAVVVNNGITWMPTPNLQFDAGLAAGVTRAADALSPNFGVSVRF